MEKRDKVIADMGNVAMRQHVIELDLRDLAASQKIQKCKMDRIATLVYMDLFLTAAVLTAIWMR